MADTVSASGNVDIALTTETIDMQSKLHYQPLIHKTYKSDQNSPEEQLISASCTDLPVAVNPNNCSPANLSTTSFRCERCDNFETSSRSTLLLHAVQCLSSPTKLKSEETDAENLSLCGTVLHVDQIKQAGEGVSRNLTKEALSSSVSGITGGNTNGSARKVFECDVCNMKFSNGANMRRHKMRHTGVKPYECRVCQKRFFRKDHLAEHFTTHTKTLPYHCPICNRGFQRQIAMRAHFQNEHVGQHDLVKTCPLCSYRAGSMKSLRIHFHNRHGIDLDNPGPGGSSSLLLALESHASQAAAAAVASFMPNLNTTAVAATSVNINASNNHSDSGESLRSTENATPPMHLLTPHVEISMPDNSGELFNENSTTGSGENVEASVNLVNVGSLPSTMHITNMCPSPGNSRDEPIDCHTKLVAPESISALQMTSSPKSHQYDNHILPSISLIPIKQEPFVEDSSREPSKNGQSTTDSVKKFKSDNENIYTSSENSKLSSLIKVSPLKSLLREDLKRRICAKANNRIIRNAAILENNNVTQNTLTRSNVSCNSKAICNGIITLSGQGTESSMLSRKQILTCLFCGIEFPDETLYFLHKGCHCESNPWKCNICGEQCNNVYEFNSHLLSKSHQ